MGIFTGLRLFFVAGGPAKARELALEEGGQILENVLDDPTHVIADSTDSSEVNDAKDCLGAKVVIVKNSWIVFSCIAKKLLPVKAFSPEPGQLFSGFRVCLSQLKPNDASILWCAIESHGGKCVKDFDKTVTHLVCCKATGDKFAAAMENSLEVKIVTPDWATGSLKSHTLLPTSDFDLLNLIPEAEPSSSTASTTSVPTSGSGVTSSDESLLALLNQKEFAELLDSELGSNNSNVPASQSAAMDSLTASINAVIAQSVQMEAQKKAELEGSGLSRQSSGSSHSGSDGMSVFLPDNLLTNKPPSLTLPQNTQPSMPLVRPQNQTKTALAKLLNTRSNSTGTPPYDVPHMIPPQHQLVPPQGSQQSMPLQVTDQQGQMMPQPHWQQQQQVQAQQQWKQPQVQQMGHFQPPPSPSPHMVVSPGLGPGPQGPMNQQQVQQVQHSGMMPQQVQHMGPQVSSAQMVHQQGMVHQQQMGMGQQQMQYNPQQHQMQQQQANMMMHQQGVLPQQQQQVHPGQQQFVQPQQHMGGMGNMPMQHRMNMMSMQQPQHAQQQQMLPQNQFQMGPQQQQQFRPQMQPHQMQNAQNMAYAQQIQIRQPPPYQQQVVTQRPIQQQQQPQGQPQQQQQHLMQQRMDNGQMQQGQYPQSVTPQMMEASAQMEQQLQFLQQQHHHQQNMQQQNVMAPQQPQQQQMHMMQQQQQQLHQQQLQQQQQQRPQMMDSRLQAGTPRPVLQTQLSSSNLAVQPPRPVLPPKELVYSGTDCPSVPPLKFLINCKFVLSEQKDFSGMDAKTWKSLEACVKKFGGMTVSLDSMVSMATHVLCESQISPFTQTAIKAGKRVVTPYWLNDCYRKGLMSPPWRYAHLPSSFSENDRPLKGKKIALTGFHDDEREDVIALILTLGGKYQPFLDKQCFAIICKSTESKKFNKAAEWNVPCLNVGWLHDIWIRDPNAITVMNKNPKYVFFNYDTPLDVQPKELPAHLMTGWLSPIQIPADQQAKMASTKGRSINPSNPKKRIKKQMQENECKKKRKLGPVVILFDGVEKSEENKLTKALKPLSASITEKFHVCTHLVTPRVSRTPKFLIGFNACVTVVTPKWIEDSVVAGKFLEFEEYLPREVKMDSSENMFQFREAMERKAALVQAKTQLFTGMTFCVMPRVYPQINTMSEIIASAGGKVMMHRFPKPEELKMHGKNGIYYVIIGSVADHKEVQPVIKAGLPVYSAEFVFSSIIKQQVEWECNQLDFSSVTPSIVQPLQNAVVPTM